MGKRSDFERKERDFYPTPVEAMPALMPHLPERFLYCEPCAGDGAIINHISRFRPAAYCTGASDIHPLAKGIGEADLMTETPIHLLMSDMAITNLPWDRKLMHPLIRRITQHLPMWTLIDSNWANTEQAGEHLEYCAKIVQVGRLIWEPGTKMAGKDDCAWYLFDRSHTGPTQFYGRISRADKKAALEALPPPQAVP